MAIPETLKQSLIKTATTLVAIGAISVSGYGIYQAGEVPPDIQLAMVIGGYYESSNMHIGKPYRDKIGRGQPWTVCNGVTGPEVDPNKYYTKQDCYHLEVRKYQVKRQEARRMLIHYDSYNVYVQASWLDMFWNMGSARLAGTPTISLANQGKLTQACERMPQWVNGTVNGVRTPLKGLVDRRGATRELCAEWGRSGRFY